MFIVYEDLIELPPSQFRRACGVSRQTFVAMLGVVTPFLNRTGKRGGQNCLSAENQLLLTLQYWREYRTQFHLDLDFGVSESTICRIITKVETLLVQSKQFRLPGKRCLLDPEADLEVVLIDVSAVEIERKKKQRRYCSGKKKRHTLNAQLVMEFDTGIFLAVACGDGKTHDFKLWQKSEVHCSQAILCLAGKGYQGLAKQHHNSITPKRKPSRQSLSKLDKEANRALARLRIVVEHGIRRLKRFRVFSDRYRNRRRRFGLRLHLLAGIINHELAQAN